MPEADAILPLMISGRWTPCLILFCAIWCFSACGQQSAWLPDAFALGMGYAGAANGIADGSVMNPAGLGTAKTLNIAASASIPHGLAELKSIHLWVAKPLVNSALSLRIRNYGFELYAETGLSFGYSRNLSESLSMGIELGGHLTRIKTFGSTLSPALIIGAQYVVNKQVRIGFLIQNPVLFSDISALRTLQGGILGIRYSPSGSVGVLMDVAKYAGSPVDIRLGVNYRPSEVISIRLGHSVAASTIHFGFSINLPVHLMFDVALVYHSTLGITPATGIRFNRGP